MTTNPTTDGQPQRPLAVAHHPSACRNWNGDCAALLIPRTDPANEHRPIHGSRERSFNPAVVSKRQHRTASITCCGDGPRRPTPEMIDCFWPGTLGLRRLLAGLSASVVDAAGHPVVACKISGFALRVQPASHREVDS